MQTDALFKFDVTPHSLTGTSDVLSTNVADLGAAKKLFEGQSYMAPKLHIGMKMTGGTATLSLRARFVGADNAALTTNPIILADTGTILLNDAGTALAIGDVLQRVFCLAGQTVAKQYYGVIFTQGGTSPTSDVTAVIATDPQTNMPAKKAAVP